MVRKKRYKTTKTQQTLVTRLKKYTQNRGLKCQIFHIGLHWLQLNKAQLFSTVRLFLQSSCIMQLLL